MEPFAGYDAQAGTPSGDDAGVNVVGTGTSVLDSLDEELSGYNVEGSSRTSIPTTTSQSAGVGPGSPREHGESDSSGSPSSSEDIEAAIQNILSAGNDTPGEDNTGGASSSSTSAGGPLRRKVRQTWVGPRLPRPRRAARMSTPEL